MIPRSEMEEFDKLIKQALHLADPKSKWPALFFYVADRTLFEYSQLSDFGFLQARREHICWDRCRCLAWVSVSIFLSILSRHPQIWCREPIGLSLDGIKTSLESGKSCPSVLWARSWINSTAVGSLIKTRYSALAWNSFLLLLPFPPKPMPSIDGLTSESVPSRVYLSSCWWTLVTTDWSPFWERRLGIWDITWMSWLWVCLSMTRWVLICIEI